MSKVLPIGERNRRIPQSKNEGTFDQDLFDTLKETILQANETEERLGDVGDGDSGVSEELSSALDVVEAGLDEVTDDVSRLEEELDAIETEIEPPELTAADLVVDSLAVGDVQSPMDGVMRAEKGAALGPNTSAAQHYLDIWSREANHIQLAGPNAEATLFAQNGKLGLSSEAVELDAESVNPAEDYEITLGSPQKKYLSLHAAELWVESLVAQKKTATIGGSVFVGPTTKLTASLSSSEKDAAPRPHNDQYNFIRVEHGQLSKGDVVQLEARGRVEFMRIVSDRIEIESPEGEDPLEIGTGVYRYKVERDLDGTGPNTWKEGDAVISTGRKGSGFIDLYAQRSQRAENESGPSIAISVREEDKSTVGTGTWATGVEYGAGDIAYYEPDDTLYEAQTAHTSSSGDEPLSESSKWAATEVTDYFNKWGERSALGNLSGLYDYTSDVYGVAGGRYEDAWFSVDENKGFRLMNQDTMPGQWDTDGTVRVGPYRTDISAHPFSVTPAGDVTVYGDLRMPDGDGGYQRPANWRGPWMAGVQYYRGDVVSYDGQTYICRTAHTSSTSDGDNDTAEPDDSSYWESMAQAATQAYISTPAGTAIKNSTSNLEVKAQLITGPTEETLADTSGYALVDEGGTDISTYAGQLTSGEMHYELTPSDIGGSLTVHLNDPDGDQVGTVTLIDITESIIGTTSVLSGDRSYYRPPGGSWETGTTTFEAQFTQGSTVDATAQSDVSWDGTEWTITPDPTGSNPSSIDVQYWDNGADAWQTVTGSTAVSTSTTGQSFEIRWVYTNPSGITQHAETNVLAIEGGTDSQLVRLEADSRVFTQKKDGSHEPSDIQLSALQQNIPSASFTWWDGQVGGTKLGTGSTITINHSQLSNGSLKVVLEEDGTGLTDTTTLVEVIEGTDAITVVVSNQSHTFPAESDGQVTSYEGGEATVEVYEGATKLGYDGTASPAASTFDVTASPSDNNGDGNDDLTATISTGSQSWTYDPTSMQTAVQNATVGLTIEAVRSDGTTETLSDQLTYTKAKVAQGMRLSASSQVIRLNKDGTTDNSPNTLTAHKQNVSESVSWSSSNTTFKSTSGNRATISYAEFEGTGVDGFGFGEPGLEGVGGDGGDEPGRPSWRSAGAAWDLPEEMSLDVGAASTARRAARGEPHKGLTGPQNRRAIFSGDIRGLGVPAGDLRSAAPRGAQVGCSGGASGSFTATESTAPNEQDCRGSLLASNLSVSVVTRPCRPP